MAICGGLGLAFEVGPVFRAEDSYTHRHLCLCMFVGLDVEMEIKSTLDEFHCDLQYLPKTLRLTYEEGIQMLKEAVMPTRDLNTEAEKKLSRLVRQKYNTDFYMLCRYPMAVRPFYTMHCYDDPMYSNSFDVFIRGEEIIFGAQRVHIPELLTSRVEACGIHVKTDNINICRLFPV